MCVDILLDQRVRTVSKQLNMMAQPSVLCKYICISFSKFKLLIDIGYLLHMYHQMYEKVCGWWFERNISLKENSVRNCSLMFMFVFS